MKKTKEFAKCLEKNKYSKEAVTNVFIEMATDEVEELKKLRHVKSGRGLCAILRQQQDKWSKIARLSKGRLSEYGFAALIVKRLPETRDCFEKLIKRLQQGGI